MCVIVGVLLLIEKLYIEKKYMYIIVKPIAPSFRSESNYIIKTFGHA